jgi:hypothetical protein
MESVTVDGIHRASSIKSHVSDGRWLVLYSEFIVTLEGIEAMHVSGTSGLWPSLVHYILHMQ